MDLSSIKNKFADIFYKNKITVVYIKDIKDKRLHIILPSGKEELINYASLISYDETPQFLKDFNQILTILKEKQKNREILKDSFNLKEIWEIVVDEIEDISAKDIVELILGKSPHDDEVAAFIRKVIEEKIYFKLKKPDKLEILPQSEVRRLLLQKERELEKLRKLNEGENFIKALQKKNIQNFSKQIQEFWINALKEYVLWENQTSAGKLVQEVLKRLGLNNQCKIFELLVNLNIFDKDENLEILKTKYPLNFSEKELKEAKNLENLIFSTKNRVDLTHLQTFTIDAEDTKDFDDGLSFEEKENSYVIYVHIAEVADFIKPKSALWEGALERATTLYLPDKIFPMLPFSLSHEKFSLKQDVLRPAITFKITLEKNSYELLDFTPFLSIIKVKKRFTYENVDNYLSQEDVFWQKLYSIFMHFKKKREKKGALTVFLPEIQIKLEDNNKITVKKIYMTPARYLIAEAMILTNMLTAEFLYKNQIPAIYRSQPQPSEIIENFEKNLYSKLLQLKYLTRSELSTQPAYHSGLGVEYYTTLTSPIRRFLDLLMQYQLKSFLSGNKPLSKEQISKILPDLINNIQRAIFIQTKREKYFLLKYLQLYMKNQPLKGLILNVQNKKAKVYLIDYNITGDLMCFKNNLTPGQEIMVKIEKIHPRLEILRFKII